MTTIRIGELNNKIQENEKKILVATENIKVIQKDLEEIKVIAKETRDTVLVIGASLNNLKQMDDDMRKLIEEQKKFKEEVNRDKGKLLIIIPIIMLIISFFVTFGLRQAISHPQDIVKKTTPKIP